MILATLLFAFVYIGVRLSYGFGEAGALGVMLLALAAFLCFRPAHRIRNRKLRDFSLGFIHLELAGLSFLLAFVILRDLLFFPISFWHPELSAFAFGLEGTLLLFAMIAAALFAGAWIHHLGPRIVRVQIPILNLAAEFEGLTIAHVSDLHIDPSTRINAVKKITDQVLSLRPSFVALTGDIGDGNLGESLSALKELAPLTKVPLGGFYVTGNHEFYSDGLSWVRAMKEFGFKTLMNSNEVLQMNGKKLLVAGVLDPAAAMAIPNGAPDPRKALGSHQQMSPKIMLAHQPGIAGAASELGFDLQLSGHTHAGQFFPWTLIIGRVHEFAQGLGRKGKMWVYVNPGTGSWGPKIRLGSRTEITLLTLTRETAG